MSTAIIKYLTLFGLFELDEKGVVLYARVENGEASSLPAGDLAGRNFFNEVEPFMTADEMRRPVAFLLSGQMAFAYFTVHARQGFWPTKNEDEVAVFYCFAFLYFVFAGGGPWSLDAWLIA